MRRIYKYLPLFLRSVSEMNSYAKNLLLHTEIKVSWLGSALSTAIYEVFSLGMESFID